MKKINFKIVGLSLTLVCVSMSAHSDQYTANSATTSSSSSSSSSDDLTQYVKELGAYLGYDLDTSVTAVEAMLNYTFSIAKTGQQMLNAFFAAIPVNAAFSAFSSNSSYSAFNDQANLLFKDFNTAGGADVAVVANYDQQTYQSDPVSQAILNLLSTPNTTTCPSSSDPSECLNQNTVMNTVLQDITSKDGYLPGETKYYTYEQSNKILSQLNVNTLLSPLIYSTTDDNSNTSSFPAKNQQQQAMDFVRYATAGVQPIDTMKQDDYSALWNQAKQTTEGQDQATIDSIEAAKKELASYLISLRVYAAQSSVAISNLYGIMGKRMPQATSDDGSTEPTSQAFNEFQSATWRLYNPKASSSTDQWVDQINASSSATIQKEIAILLSEINYQMYLNRQQEERMLLTNSLALLQLLANTRPNVISTAVASTTQ
ncbi:MAG: type IV secretion protein IcmX [Gammaproteobacteria bacterium]|nr:type IV secretion protein IcmX [Gammaproteobacteria bacterium]